MSFSLLPRLLFILSALSALLCASAQKEVTCKHYNAQWLYFKRNLFTCRIEKQRIDDVGFIITSTTNTTVDVLDIQSSTDVKFIPENIADKFPQLIALQIFNCSVESISEQNFKSLRKLKYLHLPRNEIESIDKNAFKDLVRLEWLSLFHNNIEYLHSQVFSSLENLKFLHVGENRLEALSPRIILPLKKLEVLNLKKNQIEFLNENIFDVLRNIRNISLSHNRFETIEKSLFKNNSKLEYIWLHANQLKSISSDIFDDMKSLKYVNLEAASCIDHLYFMNTFSHEKLRNDLAERCQLLKEKLETCTANEAELSRKLTIVERKLLADHVYSNQLELKTTPMNERLTRQSQI